MSERLAVQNPMIRYAQAIGWDFPQADRFMQTVHRAWEGVYSLSVALHYLSCEGGVGRESE